MSEALKPKPALLCKLGSLAVHLEEFLSDDGNEFDKAAIQSLLEDPEVKASAGALARADDKASALPRLPPQNHERRNPLVPIRWHGMPGVRGDSSMSPKCPQCGYEPPKGRPKKLDDRKVAKLRKEGKSLAEIAAKLGVTRGAIQAALRRTPNGREGEQMRTVHFVRFLYPGILVSETSEREVETRDPKKVDVPATAFGFYFFDKKLAMDGKDKLWGKETNTSGIYYYGKEMTLADVEKEMPSESILISNMRGNGYKRVVFTGRGTFPLRDDDVILGPRE